MVDARLAICWAVGDWLVTYAGWRDRELRRIGFHANGIPFAAKRWFPAEWLTDAFRQQVSRGLRRLEREGVLVRVTGDSGRTTHVRPTTLLADVLLELATERDAAEATAIRKSLGLTVWGQAILAELANEANR
jgi:hypothetical protein